MLGWYVVHSSGGGGKDELTRTATRRRFLCQRLVGMRCCLSFLLLGQLDLELKRLQVPIDNYIYSSSCY